MTDTTVVILAAGRGTRLRGALGGKPKGFLPFRETTFVERAIDLLAAAGVARTVIVTGHQRDFYDSFALRRGPHVETVHNPEYAEKGSAQSLLVALEVISGSIVVMDADIVYEARAIDRILDPAVGSGVLLSDITGSTDDNLAWTRSVEGGMAVVHISKDRTTMDRPPDGEHVGIVKLSPELVRDLRDVSPDMIAKEPLVAYEQCLTPLLQFHHVLPVSIPDLIWTEVDDMQMWDRANAKVFPRLLD